MRQQDADALRARIRELEGALKTAQHAADVERRAADAARESAARAWSVSLRGVLRPRGDDGRAS
jgi:hypothetical protein